MAGVVQAETNLQEQRSDHLLRKLKMLLKRQALKDISHFCTSAHHFRDTNIKQMLIFKK